MNSRLAVVKGIILAGGTGTRLHPLTISTSKQLMPVYDKPMIYYPISTLMLAGIRDILIITTQQDRSRFEKLLGDGSQWGISFSYATQKEPNGLPEAFIIGSKFIGDDHVSLILGDNIFYGAGVGQTLNTIEYGEGATIFATKVSNPEDYGVIEMGTDGEIISIQEKPANPKSRWAIPGFYVFDSKVGEFSSQLKPSKRGELEITALIEAYREASHVRVKTFQRGTAWLDTGSFDTLLDAGEFVRIVERRQGTKIGVPEEIAWRLGFITTEELLATANKYLKSGYGQYLASLPKDSE